MVEVVESLELAKKVKSRSVYKERKNSLATTEELGPGVKLENKAWCLLYSLGPTLMTLDRDPKVLIQKAVPSPDALAIFPNWGVILECSDSDDPAFHLHRFERVLEVKAALKNALSEMYQVDRLECLLIVRDLEKVSAPLLAKVKERRIALLDNRRLDYFLALEKQSGVGLKRMFWARTFPRLVSPEEISVPAMRMKIGKGRVVFSFAATPNDLLVRSFVSHRELDGPKGYQRMLNGKRLSNIAKYVKQYHTFPTPIVVAFEPAAGEHFDFAGKEEDAHEDIRLGTLRLPSKPNSIQVIDGQHRLYAYTKVEPDKRHILQVIAYKKSEALDAASMFVDINSKQKPVPQNLLWELYPEIYDESDGNYFLSIIAQVIEGLIEAGTLRGIVSNITLQSKGPITFRTICTEVKRLGLITKDGGLVAQCAGDASEKRKLLSQWIGSLFAVLKELGADHGSVNAKFMFSNVGIVPTMRVFGRILRVEAGKRAPGWIKNRQEVKETLKKYFQCLYSYYSQKSAAELANLRTERVAEAGFGETDDEMSGLIQLGHSPDFPNRSGADEQVFRAANDLALAMYQLNRNSIAAGHTKEGVFPSFDYLIFRKRFRKKEIDQDAFWGLVNELYKEVVEGGGGKNVPEGSRLAKALGLGSIVESQPIRNLDNLRNYWDHNLRALRPEKRQDAINLLKELTEKPALANPEELAKSDYKRAIIEILHMLDAGVLKPAIQGTGQASKVGVASHA
ncbi:MAG: DGQHR domain-containing protein [Acidobacteriota bacterium]|nr:DGQHR domain-containing protein [Acidobacteriota bacterium]